MTYTTITTEGGLLPADVLDAIAAGEIEGQRAEDFGVERGRNLSDEIAAAWAAVRGQWQSFQFLLGRLRASDPGTSLTRERWVVPLLEVLGYEVTYMPTAALVEGRTYAISHRAGTSEDAPPVHIEGLHTSLDARPPSGRPRLSPHALLQEYLNGTEHLWGIVTNGERLRLLRDSSRFTRPSYVEFDLRAMLEGEKFNEFALLFRLLHRSRLPLGSADATSCLLERYHQRALETGGRVRDGLRDGVEQALKTLGNGLLQHPHNAALRAKLAGDTLTSLDYYRQLLRLVYRLLFLMVAEERNLIAADADRVGSEADLLAPDTYRAAPDRRLAIYRDYYSLGRLRRMAEQPGTGRGMYDDLWLGLMTTFRVFEGSDEEAPRRLGLAPLDGDLFSEAACAHLTENTRLHNADLLVAIRALSLYRDKDSRALRRVNYAALDVEELGSVYESLLDFRPLVRTEPNGAQSSVLSPLTFDLVTGTERKTTGSYYTRPELVQELIKSALEPVIAERLAEATKARRQDDKETERQRDRQTRNIASLLPSSTSARQEALLSIRVVDPACGSGHFLLAAARRIGRELARERSGEEQATPVQFRQAVRDVIAHCIYGVDYNPLAVDLCKLALWIEGHTAGMPLSFLDAHIRWGNSLVGATRALVAQGIPDDAYKPVTGDDKKTASDIRKRNKGERERYLLDAAQHTLFDAPTATGSTLAEELAHIETMPNDSVPAVRARAAAYQRARQGAEAEWMHFNLWTAAFFQPLTPDNVRFVPTTQDLADHERRPKNVADPKVAMATAQATQVGFFHWDLEFPQVFDAADVRQSAGFDVVLGNPPWERIKLQEQEHWVDVPEVAQATNKSAREKKIQEWRSGNERQRARIALFDAAKYRAEAESRFVRASERFPLTAVGDVNTYALFAELDRNLLAPMGRAGVIVPIGIATDDSTKKFFGDLISGQRLIRLIGFENEAFIFPEVHNEFKFCALTIIGEQGRIISSTFAFFCRYFSQVEQAERQFELSYQDFVLLNPNTLTCPIFRTRNDAELVKKVYRRVPVLVNERTGENPWGISFRRIFDMNKTDVLNLCSLSQRKDDVQMYEAKMLWHYNHRFATLIGKTNAGDRISRKYEGWYSVETTNSTEEVLSRYWIPKYEVEDRLLDKWHKNWILGFRDITGVMNERTTVFSVLPFSGTDFTVRVAFPKTSTCATLCLLGSVNSLIFDYFSRQAVAGSHLSDYITKQLPVLPPSSFTAADIAFIVPRVLELVYTAWDMQPFAEDVWAEADDALRTEIMQRNAACNVDAPAELFAPRAGFPLPPFLWDDARRAVIRAELDARIARLYGLTRDELRYILDPHDVYGPDFPGETFRVLQQKEIKLYGEYRTRRLVLEAWDNP